MAGKDVTAPKVTFRQRSSGGHRYLAITKRSVKTVAPPGPMSLANVVNSCARSISRPFMAEQGREGCFSNKSVYVVVFR